MAMQLSPRLPLSPPVVFRYINGEAARFTGFDLKARTYYGASGVRAIPIGNSVLFVTDRSRRVREFRFDPSGLGPNQALDMTAMVERGDSLWATQFHPEKSGDRGHHISENFLEQARKLREGSAK